MMYAYQSQGNAFYLHTDIVPAQTEEVIVPTVDADGNPVMVQQPKLDANGEPITQDYTLDDGTVVQVPALEEVQATHTEQRPVHPPLPEGYVDVSEEEHAALFAAQAEGMVIQPDPAGTGRPVALPPVPPSDEALLFAAQDEKRREINNAHEAALAGSVALADPTPSTVAVESALLAVQDAAGLEYVRDMLDERRAELLAAVDAAGSVAEVEAVVVSYPV